MRLVVACFGNVLRGDDGFGIEVGRRLVAGGVPDGVEVLEIGIGGIHLVQQLFTRADALIVVDAIDLGRPPGTVVVLHPDVRVPAGRDDLADMHYATPDRALMLAGSLGLLPSELWLVGCQPVDADAPHLGLSPVLADAVDVAAAEVRRILESAGTTRDA